MIKETGFMEIPSDSFPVSEGISDYQKSVIKVTLNGQERQINWVEQNATKNKLLSMETEHKNLKEK